jgi:hypothetical protein
MPRLQPFVTMTREENCAHLLATIELALATISCVDASAFASLPSSSVSSASNESDEKIGQAPQ